MTALQRRYRSLIDRAFACESEFSRLRRIPSEQRLGPPATAKEIATVETTYAISFPDDYRAFLLMHNGWIEAWGENRLLSTAEMLQGPVHDSIREFQELLGKDDPDYPAARGFAIEAGYGIAFSFLDITSHRSDGGMDIVFWRIGEQERYPDFEHYLEALVQFHEEYLADERSRLR